MFVPLSKMSPQLQAHLRYPEDIFSIQSAIYGRYHLTNPAAVLRSQQRVAALAHGRRRPAVPGAAGREHLQQSGPAGLHHAGPHGAPVPGVLAAEHVPAGLHRLGRLRPGVTVEPLGLQPELQPDRVDGGAVGSRALRPARPLRDAAGDVGPGQRGRRDLGQLDGVEGHLAPGHARVPRSCSGRRSWSPSPTPWCTCARCTWRRRRTRSPSWNTSWPRWARTCRSTRRCRPS